jgi:nucleoside-diphosphate-sugar epimerase
MDVARMKKIGCSPRISLNDGIIKTIEEYKNISISVEVS